MDYVKVLYGTFVINKVMIFLEYLLIDVFLCVNTDEVALVKHDYEILNEIGFTENTVCYIIKHYRLRDTHQPISYWIYCYIDSYFKTTLAKYLSGQCDITTRTLNS